MGASMSVSQDGIISWNDYAKSFQSIMPPVMIELNEAVAKKMFGHVIDYGCGSGKLIPYLNDNAAVKSYTGIDLSEDMLALASKIAEGFSGLTTRFIRGNVLQVPVTPTDCAVSINSFYSWSQPKQVVRKIFENLNDGGVLVIGSLSKSINMRELLNDAEPLFLQNEYWPDFRRHNINIIDHPNTKLVELSELCDLLTSIGFKISHATDSFYRGGLCLVEAKK